jgi:hypothetical protein
VPQKLVIDGGAGQQAVWLLPPAPAAD